MNISKTPKDIIEMNNDSNYLITRALGDHNLIKAITDFDENGYDVVAFTLLGQAELPRDKVMAINQPRHAPMYMIIFRKKIDSKIVN